MPALDSYPWPLYIADMTKTLTKSMRVFLDAGDHNVPQCDGSRRGAARRSAWFRTAYALEARGWGKVVRVGGDVYRFTRTVTTADKCHHGVDRVNCAICMNGGA